MTGENKKRNIELELAAADEALAEASALLERGLARGAMSRAYFYVYHFTKALLFSKGLEPKAHDGAGRLLNMHFVRDQDVDQRFGRLFARLRKYRLDSDYDPASAFRAEDVAEELAVAEEYRASVKAYLKSAGLF